LANDTDTPVRFQLALSLGESSRTSAGSVLGVIATSDLANPWIRAALLSSSSKHAPAILKAVSSLGKDKVPPAELVEPLIATVTGARDQASTTSAFLAISDPGPHPAP